MFKPELVEKIALKSAVEKAVAAKTTDAFIDVVKEEVIAGGEVNIIGFGKFAQINVAERQGTKPGTGEVITIPAHKRPIFKPGKAFKEAVNA